MDLINGVSEKSQKIKSDMGYTVNKPKKLKTMSSKTEFDENLKKLEEEIERRRKMHCYEQMGYTNTCGSAYEVCQAPKYVDAYDAQGLSCAKVSAAYLQNDKSNATIEYLKNELQKLVNQNATLALQNTRLLQEVNNLRSTIARLITENNMLKIKKEKKENINEKVQKSLNKVGGGFSGLYQKFITWLNT